MFMRAYAGLFIMISLFLVGTVAAIDASAINPPNPDWIIANGNDQSTITVVVQNTNVTGSYVNGARVDFAVNNTAYGTFSPATVITGPSGIATGIFKVATKSGTANITATISYNDPGAGSVTIQKSVLLHIDHDSPYIVKFTHPFSGSVATEVPFISLISDRHGNPIDNRKEVAQGLPSHTLSLHVHGPAPDNCSFAENSLHDISRTLDDNGNLTLNIKLTSKIGYNYISMDPFGSISDKIESIEAVATGIPYSMTGTIYPDGELPANNIDRFIIDYFLYDVYGNPLKNRSISVNTNLTDELDPKIYTTNSLGQVEITYGPKISILTAKITAKPIENPSLISELIARFVNSDPTKMVLAVTPETMASRDMVATEHAFVRATVIDNWGNPVPDETVTFSLGTVSNGTYILTTPPSLSAASATTDKDGSAIVTFYPGAFAAWGEPGYNNAATGSVDIIAIWNGNPRSVTVTWKNYPYLSIETSAAPPNVKLNDTIDITIDVIGNGYNMKGGQVTAVIDMDCTSNIFSNKEDPPSSDHRIDSAKYAAGLFVDEMERNATSFIGLTSFGTDKNDQFHMPPVDTLPVIKTKIENLVKGTNAQDLGPSITDSMVNITSTAYQRANPDKIRAVILLNDGGSNINNQGEMDAIVNYAKSQTPPIWIFTVLYYDGEATTANAYVTLNELADRTDGKFFHSKKPADLAQAFLDIARILQTAAGVNATMTLDFQNVEVNGNLTSGSEVFSYVPVGPFYNLDLTPTSRDAITGRTRIMWTNSSHSVIDQSVEWNNTHQLHFDIGTVNISSRWNTTYRLKVNQTGLINIFNCTSSASSLVFDDGTGNQNLCLPNLYVTVNENVTPLGLGVANLDVSNLVVTKSGNITDYIPLQWNLNYKGAATATETMFYSYNNGPWVQFGTTTGIPSAIVPYTHTAQLDVRKLPPGGYRIKVHAFCPDSPDDEEITSVITIGSTGVFIKLE
jgi:hypothetical protein